MKHVRMLGLCLVAVFAVSGVAVATASATEYAYQSCVKASPKNSGSYKTKACTEVSEPGKGAYEAVSVSEGTPFTSKGKAATITAEGKVIKCKKASNAGEYLGAGFALETITFTDCEVTATEKCQSSGEGAGTIKTGPLFGDLIPLNEAETEPGIVLTPAESAWAVFTCAATTIELQGGVIGHIANVAKGQNNTFAVSGGKQDPQDYWSGSAFDKENLYTGEEVEATLATEDGQGPKGVGVHATN